MKSDKAPESGVIAIFVEGLENTPGWVTLSRKKQDALLEHTSHIQQNRQLQMLGEFGELMELYQVEQLLDGEEMKLSDYLAKLYPERHARTIFRKQANFAQLAATIPPGVMKKLASLGGDVLGKFDRIAKAAIGDIRNAASELPALPASTEKAAVEYLERLDSKLHEHRKARRKGITLERDEAAAAKFAANAVINYINSCGLQTSAQKRLWLTRMLGWVMEAQAVTGTVKSVRVSIPDGVIIRRGRPRKKKPTK